MTPVPSKDQTALCLSDGRPWPVWLTAWIEALGSRPVRSGDPDQVIEATLKSRPRVIVLDARGEAPWSTRVLATCGRLKRDAYTGIVPVVVLIDREQAAPSAAMFAEAFASGADEVLREDLAVSEAEARIAALLRRSDRDTDIHPSTRLPGNREISAELERRVAAGEKFAACYADLDHFKEFNDRYGYHHGDQVIRLVARILHDVVRGLCPDDGFVGHIGGDDFLYTVPLVSMARVCDEVVQVFDELIPWQYSEQDRRVGYFFGKDRRGQLHRVPLMTLSVGVVTNQRRHFTRAIEVSELATEMKSYAKTLAGSLWAVDRRREEAPVAMTAGSSGRTELRSDLRVAGGA